MPSEILFDEDHLAARPMTGPTGKQIGWGLFARRAIPAGETVLQLDLSDEKRVEVLSWDDVEDEQHNRCVAIAPRWYFYVSKQSPLWFLNHSCNPSMLIMQQDHLTPQFLCSIIKNIKIV